MNFVVCRHVYPHICIIYNVISMFYIDFWGFTNDPLYFGYNPAGQKNPVFNVFDVSGPIRSQKDLNFWECHFLSTRSIWSARTSWDGPGGPKEPIGRAQAWWARPWCSFAPRSSDRLDSFAHGVLLT